MISTMVFRKLYRVKCTRCYCLLYCLVFVQLLWIGIVILSKKYFTAPILSSESKAILSSGNKAIMSSVSKAIMSSGSKATMSSRSNAITTHIPKMIKKPVIDMVNDYHPFIRFKFVFPEIMPVVNNSDLFLVVLVNSGANGDKYRNRRAKIRQTWGNVKNCEQLRAMNNPKIGKLKWILVFVLGKASGRKKENELNAAEAKQYNDILIGNINDNYFNNIIKFYTAQLWASTLTAKYTLKTDDDVYVRIPLVIQYLANKNFPGSFYGGSLQKSRVPVPRKPNGKWSISKKYFAERVWPPYHVGAFIVISTDLIGRLLNYVYKRKPFHVDDAYLGIAMRDLKVKVTKIPSFLLIYKNKILKLLPKKSNCNILSIIALGHSLDLKATNTLHHKLELMCSKNINATSCKTFKP